MSSFFEKFFGFYFLHKRGFYFLAILHKRINTPLLKRFRNFGSEYFNALKRYRFNFLLLYHFKACFRWQNKRSRKHLFCYSKMEREPLFYYLDTKKRELSFSLFPFRLFVIIFVMCIEIMCTVFK